jgi:hypothetical protein
MPRGWTKISLLRLAAVKRRPGSGLVLAALLAIAVPAVTGCGGSSGSHRGELHKLGSERDAGNAQDGAAIGTPYTSMTFNVCAVGGPVKVSAVRLDDPRGLRLVDWGWSPIILGRALQPGLATNLGFSHDPIARACSHALPVSFAVSVERTGPQAGTESSFTIAYPSGSLQMRFGIALCPGKCTKAALRRANF